MPQHEHANCLPDRETSAVFRCGQGFIVQAGIDCAVSAERKLCELSCERSMLSALFVQMVAVPGKPPLLLLVLFAGSVGGAEDELNVSRGGRRKSSRRLLAALEGRIFGFDSAATAC